MKKIFVILTIVVLVIGFSVVYASIPQLQLSQHETANIVISTTVVPTGVITPIVTLDVEPTISSDLKPTSIARIHSVLNSEKILPLFYESTDSFSEFPQGQIYFWDTPGQYGVINLDGNKSGLIFWDSKSDPELPLPGIDVAFSRYSGQVAYLAKNENLELWISDVNINKAEKVWEDSQLWLGPVQSFDDIDFYWGPFDKYIILKSNLTHPNLVVYSLSTRLPQKWVGECNQVGKSHQSLEVSIWCEITSDGQKNFAFLGRSGVIQNISSPPDLLLSNLVNWAFSPNGDSILFSDEQQNIGVLNRDGKIIIFPLKYSSEDPLDIRTGLKWSQDSTKIMVYGYDRERALCPDLISDLAESGLIERPCWFVMNALTGDVLWYPNETISKSIGEISGDLIIIRDAVFSPDGQWLATGLNIKGIAKNYFLIASIDGKKTVVIEQNIWKTSLLLWER